MIQSSECGQGWTLSPESAHQVTWLMGDRGIPRTWRHMNGYSSHTYLWINAAGERFWVKYHFKTDQGIEFFTHKGGPKADSERYQPASWYSDGEMVRVAYTLRAQDDDWGQAGTMVREVFDDPARDRLVSNVVGHLLNGVTEPVLQRAFGYWRNADKNLGDRIEAGVRAKQGERDPKAAGQGNPARSSMQEKA